MTHRPQRPSRWSQLFGKNVIRGQRRKSGHVERTKLWQASETLEIRSLLSSTSIGEAFRQYQTLAPARELDAERGYLSGPASGAPLEIALSYLRTNAAGLGLTSADIDSLQVTNNYSSRGSGTTHLYFQQVVNGIPVINANLNINVARNGEIINVGSSILPGVATTTAAPNPQITAVGALDSLVNTLGWVYEGSPTVLSVETLNATKDTVISSAGISMDAEIPAALRYVPKANGSLELVWLLNIQTTDSNSWYDAAVSASTGEIRNVVDWVNQASYTAIEIPFENPIERTTQPIVDPHLRAPTASPFGWHDTNGAAGAEFTDTRGNNVNAQEDTDANNTGGRRPDGGANLVFNFPFDPAQSALANENAAVVNLFYWNNVIHDVLHLYGFDEPAGNFQNNNYGNGGIGGDQVEADALDGSGTNNANFATPPDGTSGRMQMYQFTFTTPTRDSDMDSFIITHEFGHGLTNRLTGGPANAGALQQAQSRGMGEGWSDFLALMLVQKPTDTQFGAYSTGNYVLGNPLNDPFGGIRDYPYSFNMFISPKTYGYFTLNSAPHPNGEIIAATLWDLNWYLINGNGTTITGKGYEPDIYNFAAGAGNTELMEIFVEALKLQPANPTYVDFRDAMLNADFALNNGDNEIAIWTAFARRGIGYSAFDGGSAASGNIIEAFDLPPGLLFELDVTPNPVFENAGVGGATGTLRRPTTVPINTPLVVTLTSSDVTELTVPASVTIPANVETMTFPITLLDDTLLDGDQIVTVTATATIANRVRRATELVVVADFESLSLTVDRDTVREDAGPGAANLTLTRSNTDAAAPNIFVSAGNSLLEYDTAGTLVQTRSIPWPTGIRPVGEDAHDLIRLTNNRIAVFNGSSSGYISIFTPGPNTWQHIAIAGLSTDPSDVKKGGITSWGNYLFLTDMQTTTGDEFGAVRYDLITGEMIRFATRSLGNRLFVKDIFGTDILEVDPVTGAEINRLPMPITAGANFGFNNGLAYDGQFLWLLAGGIGNDQVYKLNAETGTVVDIHQLGGTTEWDGLASLNGLIYALDSFIENRIHVYDPIQRQVINTLNVGTLNGVNISGGLTGITGPDRLLATSTFGDEIYEINPATGIVTARFNTGAASTEYGLAAVGNEIYVGEFSSGDLRVFNRAGAFQRTLPLVLTPVEGVFALGGDGVQGLVTTSYRYRDIFAGLDDQLYVLDQGGTAVGRYNPETLELDRFFDLAQRVNALAVAADGTIWGAGVTGTLYHFTSTGTVIETLATGGSELIDIDLNITGQILLTDNLGQVIRTKTTLVAPTTFNASVTPAFVSLGRHQTQASGDLIITLTSNDTSEATVPTTVILPVGQNSITVPINIIDDAILDGAQVVTFTAAAAGYVNTSDTLTVEDAEFVTVDIAAPQISEAAGNNATTVTVRRTNTDGPFPFTMVQNFSNTTPQTIFDFDRTRSFITVPSQSSRVADINVTLSLTHTWLPDLDIYLVSPNGTRVELVTDLPSNQSFMTDTTFDDQATSSILTGAGPFTGAFRPEGSLDLMNGLNPSGVWTLEIADDNQADFGTLRYWSMQLTTLGLAPMTVQLAVGGDPGEISLNTLTAVIPANQTEITLPVNALDDTILDGTQTASVSVSSVDAIGYLLGADSVLVTDQETLTFTISGTTVSEAAGAAALTGTLTRMNSDLSAPFTVSVTSSDTTELTVPATVTIPANQSSVTFPINAIDDAIVDGTQVVTITVSAPAYGSDLVRSVNVTDLEPSLLLETDTPTVREDGGALEIRVTRQDQSDISMPMTVNLVSSNVPTGGALALNVAASITIPANQLSATFPVTIVDNNLLQGLRTGRITASSAGIISGSIDIGVTDVEFLSVTFNKTEFLESAGAGAAIGTVTRGNTNISGPLVVFLSSNDMTELTVPATVTIPPNAASVTFVVTAVNDPDLDGPQTVTVTASASGYFDGTRSITVLDHEPPVITAPAPVTSEPRPTIVWGGITNAIRYEVWVSNISTGNNAFIYVTNVTDTQFQVPEKLGVGRYRAWVRAVDALERPGFWSFAREFRIDTAPTITAPVLTGTTAASSFPEISWTAVQDAPRYELWVNNVTTGQTRVISRTNITTSNYVATETLGSGTYTAWVRAFNTVNESGKWSNPHTFTVLAAPVVVLPTVGGTFDRTPTYSWNAVAGATSYDLWVSNRLSNAVVYRNQTVLGLSVDQPTDLLTGDYTMWVRAKFGNQFSVWSAPRQFSVGRPPVITTPGNNANVGTTTTINWTSVSGTERYELWITNALTNVRVVYLTNLTANSRSVTLAAGTYRVWVRAVSTMAETTAWSTEVRFTVASVDSLNTTPLMDTSPVLASVLTRSSRTEHVAHRSQVSANSADAGESEGTAEATVTTQASADTESLAIETAWNTTDWWLAEAEHVARFNRAPARVGATRQARREI